MSKIFIQCVLLPPCYNTVHMVQESNNHPLPGDTGKVYPTGQFLLHGRLDNTALSPGNI